MTAVPTPDPFPNFNRSKQPTAAEEAMCRAIRDRNTRIAQLTALRNACDTAISAAMSRRSFAFFESWEGHAVVNAMHDLTEIDALYDMAGEIEAVAPAELAA